MNWIQVERRRQQWIRKYYPLIKRSLDRQLAPVLQAVEDNVYGVLGNLDELVKSDYLIPIYKSLYQNVGLDFSKVEKKKFKCSFKILDTKKDDEFEDVVLRSINEYASTVAGKRIVDVRRTSKQLIEDYVKEALSESVNEGLGAVETAKKIINVLKDEYGDDSAWRALRIAITETHTAQNEGSLAGVESFGLPFEKEWSTGGANIRDAHADLDGVRIGQDEYFENSVPVAGGMVVSERMMFPGDSSLGASGGNVCNCKCTLNYYAI